MTTNNIYRPALKARRGAALLMALFIMTAASALVVAIADSQSLRYSALRNTKQWDQSRYLAEAGLHEALATLETDFTWRTGVQATEFPIGSGNRYEVSVRDGTDGEVIVQSVGFAGTFTRSLSARLKQGG
jgi:type II secretory pathway component PulK